MKFTFPLFVFGLTSLFSASLVRDKNLGKDIKEGIEIFDENISSLSNNSTSSSLKVNFQIIQPKLNIIAGHTGFLPSTDKAEKGCPIFYPERFCSGFKIEYVNSDSSSSKKYGIFLDYFFLKNSQNSYKREENSSIFLNGINASDFNNTPFGSAQTTFGYEQFVFGLEGGTFSLQLFNSSYSFTSGFEAIFINLAHSKTGVDNTSSTYGYLGIQYSAGIGSISKFEIKRRLYNFQNASFDLHLTFGLGGAYTLFEGAFQSIEIPSLGQNIEDHKSSLPKSGFISSHLSDVALVYQTTPTKEKPSSFLLAFGSGSKTLANIDQIQAISSGTAGSISLSSLYIKVGYTI
jgi:hypothetical protein